MLSVVCSTKRGYLRMGFIMKYLHFGSERIHGDILLSFKTLVVEQLNCYHCIVVKKVRRRRIISESNHLPPHHHDEHEI